VVSPSSVTFTPVNWSAPQTVTVTGVDDSVADGNQVYSIVTAPAMSADYRLQRDERTDVSLTNTDNDSAGITVNPTTGPHHHRGRRHRDLHHSAEFSADGQRRRSRSPSGARSS